VVTVSNYEHDDINSMHTSLSPSFVVSSRVLLPCCRWPA